jgi:hypothetical protein
MGVQKSKKRIKSIKRIFTKLKLKNLNLSLHKKVKNTEITKINYIKGILV